MQTLGTHVVWGWGSPPAGFHSGRQQQVQEWLRWQYVRCRARAGLSHRPQLISVPCLFLCLYAFQHAHNKFPGLANFFLPTLDFK